ncbi:hypothetical protein V8F06_011924 [Rhypophila decipiens]
MTVADEAIDRAIELVNSGVSQKEAAKQWGVPPTTLWNRLHGTRADKEVKKTKQRLTEVQEAIIADWAKSEEKAGRAPSKDWEDEARPRYMLTQKQGSLYDAFEDVAEQYGQQGVDEMVHPSALASVQAIDRLCLDTVVSLLDHQYTHSHYESAMISGLAVMGIREDGGWESVENYTPIYSAVIKMARMSVVRLPNDSSGDAISLRRGLPPPRLLMDVDINFDPKWHCTRLSEVTTLSLSNQPSVAVVEEKMVWIDQTEAVNLTHRALMSSQGTDMISGPGSASQGAITAIGRGDGTSEIHWTSSTGSIISVVSSESAPRTWDRVQLSFHALSTGPIHAATSSDTSSLPLVHLFWLVEAPEGSPTAQQVGDQNQADPGAQKPSKNTGTDVRAILQTSYRPLNDPNANWSVPFSFPILAPSRHNKQSSSSGQDIPKDLKPHFNAKSNITTLQLYDKQHLSWGQFWPCDCANFA